MADERFELKEMQKLEGHTGKVWSLAWNPLSGTDGKPAILASCSSDKTVRIWMQNPNTSTFECLKTIEGVHAGTGRSCSWSPDGEVLAIPGYNGATYIWNKNNDVFNNVRMPEGEQEEVVSVSWSPVGAHFATCSRNYFRIWGVLNYPNYDCVEEFENPTKDVKSVQWHPLEEILFICGCNNTIMVFAKHDYVQWYHAQTLDPHNGHLSRFCSISFDATGDKMVTSSEDISIEVWGAETMQSGGDYKPWEHLFTLHGYHEQTIFSVHWSSEGIIASGAADDAICLFVENQDGLSQERKGAMYKLLLRKENAHKTGGNSVQWNPKSQEKSEAMYEMQLTKKRACETDVNLVQRSYNLKERYRDMCQLLLTKEKADKTEVTAVQWGPKEIKLLASSSNNGTIKIWELTPRR